MLNFQKTRGFSLVELMVGVTVGLFVILAMSAVYINASRGSRDSIQANRLNQDMRAVMDIMVADIRRAGYWGSAAAGGTNPFTLRTGTPTDIYVSANCILYSYDATYAGGTTTADAGVDFFGFRLDSTTNTVQMLSSATLVDTSTACANTTWENMTDPNVIQVTALTFDTIGSRCLAYDSDNFNPNDASTASYAANWSVSTGTTTACATAPPSGTTIPATADTYVETRQINITLTAQHASDTSLTRTLTESVLVRNNRITGT